MVNNDFSKTLYLQTKFTSLYQTKAENSSNIFCTIKIPKISLEYAVFNGFSEDLLLVAPCRFYGVQINETGNIAIAGHNYENNTFFSDLNKLSLADKIYLYSLDNVEYIYSVYQIYETSENDLSCLEPNFINSKELTLITCNNSNKKRFIVKAIFNQTL